MGLWSSIRVLIYRRVMTVRRGEKVEESCRSRSISPLVWMASSGGSSAFHFANCGSIAIISWNGLELELS